MTSAAAAAAAAAATAPEVAPAAAPAAALAESRVQSAAAAAPSAPDGDDADVEEVLRPRGRSPAPQAADMTSMPQTTPLPATPSDTSAASTVG